MLLLFVVSEHVFSSCYEKSFLLTLEISHVTFYVKKVTYTYLLFPVFPRILFYVFLAPYLLSYACYLASLWQLALFHQLAERGLADADLTDAAESQPALMLVLDWGYATQYHERLLLGELQCALSQCVGKALVVVRKRERLRARRILFLTTCHSPNHKKCILSKGR